MLTIEEVTPSCAALFGWAFSPAIRDLDPPPAVAATVGWRGGIIQDSAYSAVWAETRMEALIPGPVSVCALDSQDAKPDAHDEGDEGDEQAS